MTDDGWLRARMRIVIRTLVSSFSAAWARQFPAVSRPDQDQIAFGWSCWRSPRSGLQYHHRRRLLLGSVRVQGLGDASTGTLGLLWKHTYYRLKKIFRSKYRMFSYVLEYKSTHQQTMFGHVCICGHHQIKWCPDMHAFAIRTNVYIW